MKKHIIMFVSYILLMISTICLFNIKTSAKTDISAQAAITVDAETGYILYEKNSDMILPMASTTKIMTALIIIENCDLSDTFTVSDSAALQVGSQLGLLANDKISVEDLLYMLLLKSANDAAETLAENAAGSIDNFVNIMNEKAKSLGLKNTHFCNPHGLPDDDHYTTAYDLSCIAREAFKNETFRKIVSTYKKKLSYHNLTIQNSDKLLKIYDKSLGGKTGFTKKAGRCLVSAAKEDDKTLITVTLNDVNDWNDHIILFENCFKQVSKYKIYEVGEYKTCRKILNGEFDASICNLEPIYAVKIDDNNIDYTISEYLLPSYFAPINKGDIAGYICLSYNGNEFKRIPLVFETDISEKQIKPSYFKKLINVFIRLLKILLP